MFDLAIALVNVQQCPKVFNTALATIICCGVEESLGTVLMKESLQKIFSERTALVYDDYQYIWTGQETMCFSLCQILQTSSTVWNCLVYDFSTLAGV